MTKRASRLQPLACRSHIAGSSIHRMRNGTIEPVASSRWLASAFVQAFGHLLAPPTPALCVSILGNWFSGGWGRWYDKIRGRGFSPYPVALEVAKLHSRDAVDLAAVFVLFVRHGRAAMNGSGPL